MAFKAVSFFLALVIVSYGYPRNHGDHGIHSGFGPGPGEPEGAGVGHGGFVPGLDGLEPDQNGFEKGSEEAYDMVSSTPTEYEHRQFSPEFEAGDFEPVNAHKRFGRSYGPGNVNSKDIGFGHFKPGRFSDHTTKPGTFGQASHGKSGIGSHRHNTELSREILSETA